MGGYAWVTLATNNSYSLGALVLAHSLKKSNTAHKLVVLITSAVSESMRNQLKTVFDVVKLVDVLDSKDEAHLALMQRPELGITFTKIHCWRLVEFEKCVFLDADTLVVRNCDELFEREEFSAAPDASWPDCFNSGVFVFKPSIETFNKILQFAVENKSFDGGDQGLLNQFFSGWATEDIKKHLPFVYNLTSIAPYFYAPAFKHYGSETRIVHFIGTGKPWLQQLDVATKTVTPASGYEHLGPLLQQWWDLFCEKVHPDLDKNLESSNKGMSHPPVEACSNPLLPVALTDEKPGTVEPCTPDREKGFLRENLPSCQPFGSSEESSDPGWSFSPVVSQPHDDLRGAETEGKSEPVEREVEVEKSEGDVCRSETEIVFCPEPERIEERKKVEEEKKEQQPEEEPPPKDPFDYESFFPDETCIKNYLEQNTMTYQPFECHKELKTCRSEPEKDVAPLPRFLTIPEDDKRQSGNVERLPSPKTAPNTNPPIEQHNSPPKEPTPQREEPVTEKRELTKSKSMPFLPFEARAAEPLPTSTSTQSIWKSQPNVNVDPNKKYSMPRLKPILPKQNSFGKSVRTTVPKVTHYTEFLMSSEYKDPVDLPKDRIGFVATQLHKESKSKRNKSNARSKFGPLPFIRSPETEKPFPKKIRLEHLDNDLYDLTQCKRQSGNKPKPKDVRRKESENSLEEILKRLRDFSKDYQHYFGVVPKPGKKIVTCKNAIVQVSGEGECRTSDAFKTIKAFATTWSKGTQTVNVSRRESRVDGSEFRRFRNHVDGQKELFMISGKHEEEEKKNKEGITENEISKLNCTSCGVAEYTSRAKNKNVGAPRATLPPADEVAFRDSTKATGNNRDETVFTLKINPRITKSEDEKTRKNVNDDVITTLSNGVNASLGQPYELRFRNGTESWNFPGRSFTHFKNLKEPVEHSRNLEEFIRRSRNLEEPVRHSTNLEGSIQHLRNLEESVGHSRNREESVRRSRNLEESVGHSRNLKEPVGHSKNLEEPVEHSKNLEKPVGRSRYLEEPVEHSRNLEEPVRHSKNLEERVGRSRYLEEPVEHSRNLEDSIKHSRNLEEPVKRSRNLEERVKRSRYLEEPVEHSRNLEEFIKHSRSLEESTVHSKNQSGFVVNQEQRKNVNDDVTISQCNEFSLNLAKPSSLEDDANSNSLESKITSLTHSENEEKPVERLKNQSKSVFEQNQPENVSDDVIMDDSRNLNHVVIPKSMHFENGKEPVALSKNQLGFDVGQEQPANVTGDITNPQNNAVLLNSELGESQISTESRKAQGAHFENVEKSVGHPKTASSCLSEQNGDVIGDVIDARKNGASFGSDLSNVATPSENESQPVGHSTPTVLPQSVQSPSDDVRSPRDNGFFETLDESSNSNSDQNPGSQSDVVSESAEEESTKGTNSESKQIERSNPKETENSTLVVHPEPSDISNNSEPETTDTAPVTINPVVIPSPGKHSAATTNPQPPETNSKKEKLQKPTAETKKPEEILCVPDFETPRSSRVIPKITDSEETTLKCRKSRSSPKQVHETKFGVPSNDSLDETVRFAGNKNPGKPPPGTDEPERVEDLKSTTGIAGAIAQLSLEAGSGETQESAAASAAHQDYLRRQNWETGNIDYMGRDSFDNIWSKICQTLETKEQEPSHVPTTAEEVKKPSAPTPSLPSSTPTNIPEFIETLPGGEPTSGPVEDDEIIFSKPESRQSELTNISEEEEAGGEGVKLSDVLGKERVGGDEAKVKPGSDKGGEGGSVKKPELPVGSQIQIQSLVPPSDVRPQDAAVKPEPAPTQPGVSPPSPAVPVKPRVDSSPSGLTEKHEDKSQPPSAEQSQTLGEDKKPTEKPEKKKEECKVVAIPSPPILASEKTRRRSKKHHSKSQSKPQTKSEPIPLPPPDSPPPEPPLETPGSDSQKDENKQKKGVFTKILEMVGVTPKEKDGSKTSNSVFYDAEGGAVSGEGEQRSSDGRENERVNKEEGKPAPVEEEIKTEKKSELKQPEVKGSEEAQKAVEEVQEKAETEIKTLPEFEGTPTEPQQPTDSIQVSETKRKSPSPKLTIPQTPPETAVTTPTPPPQPDTSPRKNSALLRVEDAILETPPVPESPHEEQKVRTEIENIIGKAKTEVETLLQDRRSAEKEPGETSDLINTMKLMMGEEQPGKEEVEELRVTSEEERKRHKGEVVSSKLSDQILKAIPPPRRKAISEASASTSAIPKSSGTPEQKNPAGEGKGKSSKPSSIPVPPPRNRGKPTHPPSSKGKGKK